MKRSAMFTQAVIVAAGLYFLLFLKAQPLAVLVSVAFLEFCALTGAAWGRRLSAKLQSLPLARR